MVVAIDHELVFHIPIARHSNDCKRKGRGLMSISSPMCRGASARPEQTAAISAAFGLTEAALAELVRRFYNDVLHDPLRPIFSTRIADWEAHHVRMVAFWSSVALMTGRYHGRPLPAHTPLPLHAGHFERWLALFALAARETLLPAGAAHVIERAESIAHSLLAAVSQARRRGAFASAGESGSRRFARESDGQWLGKPAPVPATAHGRVES